MSKTRVFMLVSEDELELPLCVEDSVELLARRVGTSKNCISSTMSKARKAKKRCRYVKVQIDDKDE